MSGRQSANAAADHHAIEGLPGRFCTFELAGIERIAYAVARGHYGMSIAVGAGVLLHAAVTVPIVFGKHCHSTTRMRELRTSVEEIRAGHLRIHAQCAITW